MHEYEKCGKCPRAYRVTWYETDESERRKAMNAEEYAKALDRLGLSQRGGARFLGIDERTSRRWIADDTKIPDCVDKLLRLMICLDLSPAQVNQHLAECHSIDSSKRRPRAKVVA